MKSRKLLLALGLLLCNVSNVSAQTTNYDPDGTYWGTPVHSLAIDFTTLGIDALPSPIVSEEIQEVAGLGVIRWCIQNRPTLEAGGNQTGPNINTLFNNNPTIAGNTNKQNEATIYLPTFKDGVGKIRLNGWVTGALNGRGMGLFYWNTSLDVPQWSWIKTLVIPGDGSNVVEAAVNMEGEVKLKLTYSNTSYMMFTQMAVSAFGEEITTGVEDIQANDVRIVNNTLLLGNQPSEVSFFDFKGVLLLYQKGVSGSFELPSGAGIVKVSSNGKTSVLKKM